MHRSFLVAILALSIIGVAACQTPEQKAAEYDKYFNEGWKLTNQGDFIGSIPYYQKAIRLFPNDPKSAKAYNNLGWAFQKVGDLQGAIAAYKKAVELDPENNLARNNLQAVQRQAAASKPAP